ncbi:MAG: C1 family peptidase [Planctomycetaceae bacterium]
MAKKVTTTSARKTSAAKRTRRPAKSEYTSRVLNCIPSTNTDDDWSFDTALAAGLAAAAAPLPASKDLRASWWKIGDQGNTGSCVGWAATDSVCRWHFVKSNRITTTQLLSVRFTWMAAKETDIFTSQPTTFIESDGTSLKAALDIARKFGSVSDADLPFASGRLYQGKAKTFYAIASRLKISNYFNLGRNPLEWRRWIAENGPILTRLDCDDNWMNASSSNGGKLDTYDAASAQGGHAVAIVGYTPTTFIIRNSWGTGWGDKGFAHASLDYAKDAFTEAYGVT